MKKETKYFLIGLVMLIILVLIYYFFFRKPINIPSANTLSQSSSTFVYSKCTPLIDGTLDFNKVLKKGVNSCETARLQIELNKKNIAPLMGLTVDGYFGAATESELIKQKGVTQITLNQFKGFSI